MVAPPTTPFVDSSPVHALPSSGAHATMIRVLLPPFALALPNPPSSTIFPSIPKVNYLPPFTSPISPLHQLAFHQRHFLCILAWTSHCVVVKLHQHNILQPIKRRHSATASRSARRSYGYGPRVTHILERDTLPRHPQSLATRQCRRISIATPITPRPAVAATSSPANISAHDPAEAPLPPPLRAH